MSILKEMRSVYSSYISECYNKNKILLKNTIKRYKLDFSGYNKGNKNGEVDNMHLFGEIIYKTGFIIGRIFVYYPASIKKSVKVSQGKATR